jgi:6-phosphogluconate dehydrogenase
MIATALFARYASAFKEERVAASAHLNQRKKPAPSISKEEVLEAYQFARAINHYQGFKLIAAASEQHNWKIQPKVSLHGFGPMVAS